MKQLLACTAAAALAASAASAGEAPYTGPGSNPAVLSAQRSCEPQVNEAERIMVHLPPMDSRRPDIVRQLQLARLAINNGDAGQCLAHVRSAREIEGESAGYEQPEAPYERAYRPYNRPVPYGGQVPYGVPAPGYSGPYAPGYGPGYHPPSGGAPWQ